MQGCVSLEVTITGLLRGPKPCRPLLAATKAYHQSKTSTQRERRRACHCTAHQFLPTPSIRQTINPVECGVFVTFGKGGVVENVVDKIIDFPTVRQHGLTDMHELSGALADDMHA